MTSKGSIRRWSASGAVLMWTIALFAMSCSANRKMMTDNQQRKQTMQTHEAAGESSTEVRHETTLKETMVGTTMTEIDIYDTSLPTDSATGHPPLKATVRQRHDHHTITRQETAEEVKDRAVEVQTNDTSETIDTETTHEEEVGRGWWQRVKYWAGAVAGAIALAVTGIIIRNKKNRKQ